MNARIPSRRWLAADRPAMLPPGGLGAGRAATGWELVSINSRTATFRHNHIIGEMADDAVNVRVMDPAPWLLTTGERAADPGEDEAATWEPRTARALRADGVILGMDQRSPYDTGERAEPRPWSRDSMDAISRMVGADVAEALDRFGRVDFEDDASQTIAVVYVEHNPSGRYTVHVDPFGGSEGLTVKLDGTEMVTPNAAAPLLEAVQRLADALDSHTLHDVMPGLACYEADALAAVFTAAGDTLTAGAVLDFHALGDSEAEGDDEAHVERAKTARQRQGMSA